MVLNLGLCMDSHAKLAATCLCRVGDSSARKIISRKGIPAPSMSSKPHCGMYLSRAMRKRWISSAMWVTCWSTYPFLSSELSIFTCTWDQQETPKSKKNKSNTDGQKMLQGSMNYLNKSRTKSVFEIGPPAWIKKEINASTIENHLVSTTISLLIVSKKL